MNEDDNLDLSSTPNAWTSVTRPGKKRKTYGSPEPKENSSLTKMSKYNANEDSSSDFTNESLTCEQTGYSNFSKGNGLLISSAEENRQVSPIIISSDSECDNSDHCTNLKSEDQSNTDKYSNLCQKPIDSGMTNKDKIESSQMYTQKCHHSESYPDPILELDMDYDPDTTLVKTPYHYGLDNSLTITEVPKLTELVKTLFTPKTAESFSNTLEGLNVPLSTSALIDTHDSSELDADALARENNKFLREMANSNKTTMTFLKSIHATVTKNASDLIAVRTCFKDLEEFVDTSITSFSRRLDTNDKKMNDLTNRFDSQSHELHTYIDSKVETITSAFPDTLAKLGEEVDAKFSQNIDMTKHLIHQSVSNLPQHNDVKLLCENTIKRCIDDKKILSYLEIEDINRKLGALKTTPGIVNDDVIRQLRADITDLKRQNTDLSTALANLKKSTSITNPLAQTQSMADKQNWESFKARTEATLASIPEIQSNLATYEKRVQTLDVRSRKLNLIIEQLSESHDENTLALLNSILDHALQPADRSAVDIVKAFRLGQKSPNGPPRKILVELSSPKGREILLSNAKNITRAGNDGKYYFINEDLPESVRRHKSDIYKYLK